MVKNKKNVFTFVDSNIQTFPSSEVQDKITAGVSRPPGDADGMYVLYTN